MSKVVSGIGKAVGGIVKGVKKAFKAVTSSKFGKVLMIAAAIYLGGAAMGAWNSPFASINGVLGAATPAAEAAAASTSLAETALAGGAATGEAAAAAATAAEGAAAGGVVGAAAPSAAEVVAASQAQSGLVGGAMGAGETLAGSELAGAATEFMGGASGGGLAAEGAIGGASAGQSPGLIQSALSTVGDAAKGAGAWVQKNPVSAMLLGNTVSGAFKPDAIEQMDAKAQKEMELYEWKNRYLAPNWNVSGVNLGFQPNQNQQLQTAAGAPVYAPNGMINNVMKG